MPLKDSYYSHFPRMGGAGMPCKATWGHTSFVQRQKGNEESLKSDICCGVAHAGQGPQLRTG